MVGYLTLIPQENLWRNQMSIGARIKSNACAAYDWVKKSSAPEPLFALIACLAAIFTVWQTSKNNESDRFNEFRMYLVELNYVAREATRPEASQICSPESGCMGSLTVKQSYFDQYELLAMNAYQIAEELDELETETMAIADALYKCGKLDKSVEYSSRLLESLDYSLRFRANLLLAQICFFKGEPERGERHIKLALEIISDADNEIPKVEQGVMRAQAHLTHGRMLVAMGRSSESSGPQKAAFNALKGLPETNRVKQLMDTLKSLIAAAQERNQMDGVTFEQFAQGLAPTISGIEEEDTRPLMPEAAPAAPPAPDPGPTD